jgi:hypothetical protein
MGRYGRYRWIRSVGLVVTKVRLPLLVIAVLAPTDRRQVGEAFLVGRRGYCRGWHAEVDELCTHVEAREAKPVLADSRPLVPGRASGVLVVPDGVCVRARACEYVDILSPSLK